MAQTTHEAVKLAMPGAGIPLVERLATRFFVLPKELKRKSWDELEGKFMRETIRVLELTEPLDEDRLGGVKLIDRIPGMEDSSRNWSAAMAMDHLRFVSLGIGKIIEELTQGRLSGARVEIAELKPDPLRRVAEVRADFRAFAHTFLPELKSVIGSRESRLTHRHPWFGELSAKGWLWVLAAHQGVHRRQIQAILRGLS